MRELDISVGELSSLSKFQFKTRVKEAIRERNAFQLLEQIKTYKKIDYLALKDENFETKQYFFDMPLEKARMKFALDTKMLKGVKMNFSSEPMYEDNLWQCNFCLRVESTRHIKNCPYFEEQRMNKNLNNDNDIIAYFQEVMIIRIQEES